MKLFAIYIGGELTGANIELHDMRFVVAPSIGETHAKLLCQWWGKPGSLHIDCWAEITHADGYEISLRPDPYLGSDKLYYVNLGGYAPGGSVELHRNAFVVAETEGKAKGRALKTVADWIEPHRDEQYEAEQAFCLNEAVGDSRLYVHLLPASSFDAPVFTCEYIPIKNAR